jgi:S1-C subfamily serine protease
MERPSRRRSFTVLAAVLAAAVLGGGIGAATVLTFDSNDSASSATTVKQTTAATSAPVATSTDLLSIAEIAKRTTPSVVEITVSGNVGENSQGQPAQQAQGSGWVYDAEGHVITNQHVVEGASSVRVMLQDGKSYPATVVGADPSTDLAVIKVDAPADLLVPLELGDSDALEVGDGVVAIGSPFGLEGSVTSGIVSALHREMRSPNGFSINDSIQTDAAINHGNSGGPLLDLVGKVVGVNAQIESDSGGNDGVGFAIPAATVSTIASQLIESGSVEHAYLGVTLQEIPADVADQVDGTAGAAIAEVRPGTPAAQAGLKAATSQKTVEGTPYPSGGDVVTEADGQPITTSDDLQKAVDAKKPGDTMELTVVRDGKTRTVTVTLGTRPTS